MTIPPIVISWSMSERIDSMPNYSDEVIKLCFHVMISKKKGKKTCNFAHVYINISGILEMDTQYWKLAFRVERPHIFGPISIHWPNLNLMFQGRVRELLKEHFIDSHIKCWNHFLGVINQLSVKVCIKFLQMFTVDVQEWLSYQTYLNKCTYWSSSFQILVYTIFFLLSHFQE